MQARIHKGPFRTDDYHRLAEVGILGVDDRVKLLDEQIVEMTPIGPDHLRRTASLAPCSD